MKFKQSLLLTSSLLAISLATPQIADACISVTSTATLFGSTSCISWTGGNFSITNTGTISASSPSLYVSVSGNTLTNNGHIIGSEVAVENVAQSNISLILNNSSGTITTSYSAGIDNHGTIGTITNNGLIHGATNGINNIATIGTISNNGLINGNINGAYNSGTITAITNAGTITTGNSAAIVNSGHIGTITNSGLIGGGTTGIFNSGTIDTLTNSGTIGNGNEALVNTGSIGTFANNGTVYGNIDTQNHDFTIGGGNSSTYGVLTGGNIYAGNLTFDTTAFQLIAEGISLNSGAGTLTNNGHIQVNNSHTVTGNFVQAAGGVLDIGVTSSSVYGKLNVTGSANMAGSSVHLVQVGNAVFTLGETFTIVSALANGTNYSNVTADGASGFKAVVSNAIANGFDNLIITLSTPSTYQQDGTIAGRAGGTMGNVLDSLSGNSSFSNLLTNINSLSGETKGVAIQSLAPNQITAQVVGGNINISPVTDVIDHHQYAMLGNGNDGLSMAAGSEYRTGMFWGQIMGGDALRSSDSSTDGFRQSFFGLTVGADMQVTDSAVLGTAFSWTHSNAQGSDSLSNDKLQVDSYQLSGYGTKRWDSYFVTGMLGIASNHFDQNRYVIPQTAVATSSYNGWQETAKIEGGRDFAVQRFTVTPFANLQTTYTQNQSYSEDGAGVANLGVNHQNYNAYSSNLGVRANTRFDTSIGALVPEVKVAYVHDWTTNMVSTSGILGGTSFTTHTAGVARDGAQLGLGATLEHSDSMSIHAEYNGDFRSDYFSSTALLKAGFKF